MPRRNARVGYRNRKRVKHRPKNELPRLNMARYQRIKTQRDGPPSWPQAA